MFDIGWGEMVVIGIVALIAIGPKELPTVLRTLGQWTGKIRRMAGEFQGQFQEAMREAEIADLKKQFDDAAKSVNDVTSSTTGFDPLKKTREEIESALDFHSDASAKPAAPASTDAQIPSEAAPAAVPPTTEAVASPPPEAPAPPPEVPVPPAAQPVNIDVPLPEPAPLDPALTPAAPVPAAEPAKPATTSVAATPSAAQAPKESGA